MHYTKTIKTFHFDYYFKMHELNKNNIKLCK